LNCIIFQTVSQSEDVSKLQKQFAAETSKCLLKVYINSAVLELDF